jgi:hypothetical protein
MAASRCAQERTQSTANFIENGNALQEVINLGGQ